MTSNASSGAYFNPERMLIQHQAALVLLQGILMDPEIHSIQWLDLASGRGQILANLDQNFSSHLRQKITYTGYDIDNALSRNAERIAGTMSFAKSSLQIGELDRFSEILPREQKYDFITLTNAIHEIPPALIPGILFDCLDRLTEAGCLFIYDMDKLSPLELGAVAWTARECDSILRCLFDAIGCEYRPEVGEWKHRDCNGWNAQIRRSHIRIDGELHQRREQAVEASLTHIRALLAQKFQQTMSALTALSRYGPQSGGEESTVELLLHDLFAITAALDLKP